MSNSPNDSFGSKKKAGFQANAARIKAIANAHSRANETAANKLAIAATSGDSGTMMAGLKNLESGFKPFHKRHKV